MSDKGGKKDKAKNKKQKMKKQEQKVKAKHIGTDLSLFS